MKILIIMLIMVRTVVAYLNRSNALRQIKLDMIQGKKGELYQHPYFWSPVVMFGDGM